MRRRISEHQRLISLVVGSVIIIFLGLLLWTPLSLEQKVYYQAHHALKQNQEQEGDIELHHDISSCSTIFISRMEEFDTIKIARFHRAPDVSTIIEWRLEQAILDGQKVIFRPIGCDYSGRAVVALAKRDLRWHNGTLTLEFPTLKKALGTVYRLRLGILASGESSAVSIGLVKHTIGDLSRCVINDQPVSGVTALSLLSHFSVLSPPLSFDLMSWQTASILVSALQSRYIIPLLSMLAGIALFLCVRQGKSCNKSGFENLPLFSRKTTGRFFFTLIIVILTLTGFWVRLEQLDFYKMTIDEEISRYIIDVPATIAFRALLEDKHPPLYYLLLKMWSFFFGNSPFSLRFLSVLASSLCIPVVALLSLVWSQRRTAILSATMLTLLPYHIYYARIARMYSLLGLLSVLSLYCFCKLLKNSFPRNHYFLATVNLGLLLTHYFGIFIVLLEYIILGSNKDTSTNVRCRMITCMLPGLLLCVWLITNLAMMVKTPQHMSSLSFEQLNTLFWLASPFHGSFNLTGFHAIFGVLLLISFFLGIVRCSADRSLSLVPVIVAGPLALVFIVSHFCPIYQPRNMFILIPILPFIWSHGISSIFRRNVIMNSSIILITLVLVFSCYRVFRVSGYNGELKGIPHRTELIDRTITIHKQAVSEFETSAHPKPKKTVI